MGVALPFTLWNVVTCRLLASVEKAMSQILWTCRHSLFWVCVLSFIAPMYWSASCKPAVMKGVSCRSHLAQGGRGAGIGLGGTSKTLTGLRAAVAEKLEERRLSLLFETQELSSELKLGENRRLL